MTEIFHIHLEAVILSSSSCSTMLEYEEILISSSRRETVDLDEIFSYLYREISIGNYPDFQLESDYSFFHCFLLSKV